MSWIEKMDKFDAVWQLKRPANFQHLLPYQAVIRWSEDGITIVTIVVCSVLSSFFLFLTAHFLEVRFLFDLLFLALAICVVGVAFAEVGTVLFPYTRINQLTTYGTARWADANDLRKHNMLVHKNDPLPPGWILLGRFKRKFLAVLPPSEWLRHLVIYGITGSGKTATFFMWWLRQVGRGASAVVIDPKGELYKQTAHHFKRVFRLDLSDPSRSDYWNFVPKCAGNPEFAHTMAAMMIGLEHSKRTNQDPFWGTAEHVSCTAILMYLATVVDTPTPPMVYEYAALRDDEGFAADMANSDNYYVKLAWRAFQKAPKPTQGSVMIGLCNKLYPFFMEHARLVTTPLGQKQIEAGAQEIDFLALQEPGTAIFIVIPEGDASRYKDVLATFVGQGVYELRADDETEKKTPVLFLIEEAYNIPVAEIKQVSGVGRGRGIGLCLCYQNYSQPLDLYGRDGANAILGTVVTKIILPGCDEVTAEYASKMLGPTTTLSRTDVDAPGKKYDNRRASETGRPLRFPAEIRQMTKHTEAYVPRFGKRKIITFEEAEAAFNEQRALQIRGEAGGGEGKEGRGEAGKAKKGGAGGGGKKQLAGGGEGEPAGAHAGGGTAGGPRGARKEKPPARSRTEEAAETHAAPPGGGAKQGALWVGVNHAINSTAREAVEQTGARARVIKKTVGTPDAPMRDDDLILNGGAEHEYGSREHVDEMFA
jgi:type IV secretion system protein VirD4